MKKATMNVLIIMVIALIVLVLIVLVFGKTDRFVFDNTSCEAKGGSCVAEGELCDNIALFRCPENQVCCLEV